MLKVYGKRLEKFRCGLWSVYQNTLESDFSVVNKKVIAKKGGQEMCESDNDYLLSALQEIKISLNDYDYGVKVSKKEFEFASPDKKNKLALFHYEMVLLNSEQAMEDRFPVFKNKDYMETYIPQSEAPTSCYTFANLQTLNLVCHYGHKKHEGVEDIVKYLK